MRQCLHCDKPARVSRRLCRTCETNKLMEKRYHEFKEQFEAGKTSVDRLMKRFMMYLDESYGDQKREIATRSRYVHNSLLNGDIEIKDIWTIEDVDTIERYREKLPVQHKTSLYHFIQFIKATATLHDAEDEIRISRVIEDIPERFRLECQKYLSFLRDTKKLKHWTRYQWAYSLKYFFTYIVEKEELSDLKQIGRYQIIGYLKYLGKTTSQKNVYTRSREVDLFFKWAKREKRVFSNPAQGVEVQHYADMTQALSMKRQQELTKRWLNPDSDPRESLVGLLSLIYACSPHELMEIRLSDIDHDCLTVPGRQGKLILDQHIIDVLHRYLAWRSAICRGSACEYLIVSRVSYKTNSPVSLQHINQILKTCETTANQLRITQFIEIATTGNIKLLESLGLSYEGTRQYLQFAAPVLFMDLSTDN